MGNVHVGDYQIIEFQKERHVENKWEHILQGDSCPESKKAAIHHYARLQSIVKDHAGCCMPPSIRRLMIFPNIPLLTVSPVFPLSTQLKYRPTHHSR